MKLTKLRNRLLGVSAVALLFAGGWEWQNYQCALKMPVVLGEPVIVEIHKGDSFQQITKTLTTLNLPIQPLWFKVLAIEKHAFNKLKAGEYELKNGMTMPDVLALFSSGKTKRYAITFPEGWTLKQVLQSLNDNPKLDHQIKNADTSELMAKLGASGQHPEGLFFPDTYFFEKHTSDIALLTSAYRKLQSTLEEAWQHRAEGLPIKTPYEALILASIVEKETGKAEERPQIAGVFIRRLQQGMLLQTDPTVIYGMGESYQGNIRHQDLIASTPYNTYIIKGLPPTPIAMPGKAAINAALHPDNSDKLYFVAKGDGSHQFSTTLEEHNQAVNTYQKKP